MENKTSMSITNKLWKKLNELRENPKETFENVIWRIIKEKEKTK